MSQFNCKEIVTYILAHEQAHSLIRASLKAEQAVGMISRMDILKSSLVALLATLFCIWLLRPLAHRIGFVDRPGGRKVHEKNTPLIGGISMFFGFCFALLSLHVSLEAYRGMIAGSSLLILMGVVDDFKELGSRLRLVGQLLATIFLITWGNQLLNNLGNIFFLGNFQLGLWAFPITVFCVMGYLNAMNMIDGQDGLAGGVALTQSIMLLGLAIHLNRYSDLRMLIILSVLLIVFLAFNMRFPWRKKASVFMGDSGITFIAFLIAWFSIELSQANIQAVKPITVLWVVAFPIFDLIAVSIFRMRQGKSILKASRDHFHHVLHLAGVNVQISTLLLCLLSLVLGCIGIGLNYLGVSEGWQFVGIIIALMAYLTLVKLVRDPQRKELTHAVIE